jgi:hypothetical protein
LAYPGINANRKFELASFLQPANPANRKMINGKQAGVSRSYALEKNIWF